MDKLKEIAERIKNSEAILIGASNGLSIAEGYDIFSDDNRFIENFSDFREKYGFRSLIQGAFANFESDGEKWSYFSRMAYHYTFHTKPSILMQSLYALVKEKPHFVVTSNTDDHFAMAGFDRKNIFEIEGNMRKMQCARGCHDIAYYSHDVIMNMLEHEEGMEIPNKYIPKCRKCNGTMIPHIAINKYFVQDREWNNSYRAYQSFVKDNHDKKLLILELGVGARNHMIKAPFMELVNEEESAFYITFNKG